MAIDILVCSPLSGGVAYHFASNRCAPPPVARIRGSPARWGPRPLAGCLLPVAPAEDGSIAKSMQLAELPA